MCVHLSSGPGCYGAGNNLPLASGARGTWQDSVCLTRGSACLLYRKDFEISQLNSRIEDGQVTEAQLQKKIKELQVWWEELLSQSRNPKFPSDVMCWGICMGQSLSEHGGVSLAEE